MLNSFIKHGLTQLEAESESIFQILAGLDSTADYNQTDIDIPPYEPIRLHEVARRDRLGHCRWQNFIFGRQERRSPATHLPASLQQGRPNRLATTERHSDQAIASRRHGNIRRADFQ